MNIFNKNDENFGARLLRLISQHFKSQSDFAEKLGKPVQSINRIIKTDKASLDFLNEIVEIIPDVNLNWLLKGEGSMMNADAGADKEHTGSYSESVSVPKLVLDVLSSQQRTIENLSETLKKTAARKEGHAGCAAAG
jgi:hypothetical protein